MSAPVLFDTPGPRARRNIMIANVFGILIIAGILALVVSRFSQTGQLEASKWSSLFTAGAWTNYFLPGLQNTVVAAIYAVVLSVAFGIVFGLGRLAPFAWIRWVAGAVVEFFRAVPVLIMMFALWFGLSMAKIVDPTQTPLVAVVVALMLYNGSIIAELVRSGVYGLPKGQREAASAIGMTHNQSLRIVELPQALIAMLPSLLSQFVVILKDTALGYLVTYNELLTLGRQFGSGNSNLLQTLLLVAVVFIVINYTLTKLADIVARRTSRRTSGKTAPHTPLPVARAADQAID